MQWLSDDKYDRNKKRIFDVQFEYTLNSTWGLRKTILQLI